MTPGQVTGLAPALTEFLGCFRRCFGESRTVEHFRVYCRGLLSDLDRKSVEPMAVAAGGYLVYCPPVAGYGKLNPGLSRIVPVAFSYILAARRSVSSLKTGPMSCMPMGRPALERPAGIEMPGTPARFALIV